MRKPKKSAATPRAASPVPADRVYEGFRIGAKYLTRSGSVMEIAEVRLYEEAPVMARSEDGLSHLFSRNGDARCAAPCDTAHGELCRLITGYERKSA